MRTKLAVSLVMLSVWAASPLEADCVLNGPGISAGSQKATACPFQKDVSCEPCYKFVFNGMECKGNTSGGSSSGSGSSYNPNGNSGSGNGNTPSQHSTNYNNGYTSGYSNGCSGGYDDGYNDGRRNRSSHPSYDDSDNHHGWYYASSSYNSGYYTGYEYGYNVSYLRGYDDGSNSNSTGSLTCKASVCDNKPTPKTGSCSAQYSNVSALNNSPNKSCSMSPSCVFRAESTPITCKMTWKCEGSAPKPNAVFNILAEFQKDPPPPTGSLNFAVGDWMLQQQSGGDVTPDGVAKVTRE